LADEPTGNLDSKSANEVIRLLISLNRKSKRTVILITHNPDYLEYADRIFYLKDGRVVDVKVNSKVKKVEEIESVKKLKDTQESEEEGSVKNISKKESDAEDQSALMVDEVENESKESSLKKKGKEKKSKEEPKELENVETESEETEKKGGLGPIKLS